MGLSIRLHWRTVLTTIRTKTTNKKILKATRTRLLETSLPYSRRCLSYIRSFGSQPHYPSPIQAYDGPSSKNQIKTPDVIITWTAQVTTTTIKYKIQDLIDNGTIVLAPPVTQYIGLNPLPMRPDPQILSQYDFDEEISHGLVATYSSFLYYGLGPLMKSNTPLVAPMNYFSLNPFIIVGSASVNLQPFALAKLTISFIPQSILKQVLIQEGMRPNKFEKLAK